MANKTTFETLKKFRKVATTNMEFYAVAKDYIGLLKDEYTMAIENNQVDLGKEIKDMLDSLQNSQYKVIK